MNLKEIIRHIIGYAVGISLFFVLIPLLFWFIATRYDPLQSLCVINNHARIAIAVIFSVVGVVFVFWSNAALFFIGKGGPTDGFGIVISPRTKHLVVAGPYRYTRNPMIFGALCCYIALGIYLTSVVVVTIVVVVTPLFMLYLTKTEEKRLLRDFGDEFLEYKKSVPMLFPKFTIKNKY